MKKTTPSPTTPHLTEPPAPATGELVPGSPFSNADWAMAAHRLAAGWTMVQVAKAMGCHRNTVSRALHGSPDFAARVEWERVTFTREAMERVNSMGSLAATQIERALQSGDTVTARWVIDRLDRGRAMPVPPPAPSPVFDAALSAGDPQDDPDAPLLDRLDEFKPDLGLPQ